MTQRRHSLSRSLVALALVAAAQTLAVAGLPVTAHGEDVGIRFDSSPGTGAPPPTLGPYAMSSFPSDDRGHDWVDHVDGPTGRLLFERPMQHQRIGDGWATWSHGYTGDVYQTDDVSTNTVILPQGTRAFYFYAEPDPFDELDIVAQTADGTSSGDIYVEGDSGAQYYGFYATGDEPIAWVTISSSTDFAIGEFGVATGRPIAAAQALFVHGVTQSYRDDTLFPTLRGTLRDQFGTDLVNSFEYYQDKGDDTGSGCDPVAAGQADPPIPDPLVGMPYDASQNGAICDSEGDIGQNAVRLDHEVARLYHEHGDRPVILMGYSMGGETIRSMLAYSTYMNDGVATGMVDSVLLMHGVEQGSWIAEGSKISSIPLVGSKASDLLGKIAPNPSRPAVKEFAPSSDYMHWVAQHSDLLPDIPMYNTWGDEREVIHQCAFVFFCHDSDVGSAGDVILQPGTDDPTEIPSGGGERFLPGGASTRRWQWAESQTFTWDPTADPYQFALDVQLLGAPMSHSNYPHHQDELTVKDCQTGESINETTELLRVMTARMEGTTYECTP